uniref:NADH-ubiquinone oxidoreductase chain 4 n=1 Tax=Ogataea parapolymorpha (strain ATCC 26012 / BCRC 20466 / JCM 22074 / NRRL Y-7560 / DL-1) TaxID=871575 RepID=E7E838_OGAPD|nr:NADH dehydrogenase subunit 4 [Ogataea polymorpha]ADT63569.1 NADH dehydrogenase subunit 4 [Ogataea polymorpha]
MHYLTLFNVIYMNTMIMLYKTYLVKITQYKRLMSQTLTMLLMMDFYYTMYNMYYMDINEYGYINIIEIFSINIGYDTISMIFFMLTLYLGIISIISNWVNMSKNMNQFMMLLTMLMLLMSMNFICLDLMSFYILFESTLMPLFLIIGIYGGNNKNKAAYYMLMYTLCSSLFMTLSIMLMYCVYNDVDYMTMNNKMMSMELQSLLIMGFMIGTGVKTPLVPIHTWLPLVHSESPLGGSILLAGIILKLAIYGIIRLLLSNISEVMLIYTPIFYVIGIITIIYSSLITLQQTDLKVIIAYSSISHLAVCILGIFSNNLLGLSGSTLLSIAHAFVSPALFLLVGGVTYDRYHNRILYYYQGLAQFMPMFSIYTILFSFSNSGTPLSFNFIGEFTSTSGIIINHKFIGFLATLSIMTSASYQMKLTNKLYAGIFSPYTTITYDLIYREHFLLLMLFIPTLTFGIFPQYMTNFTLLSLNSTMYTIII